MPEMAKQGDCATPFEHRPQMPGGPGVRVGRCGSISNRFGRMRQMVAETATALFFRIISIEGLLIRCESIGN
ncbi:hypothetical protein [Burkholderia pseudomallei]|uniref:hypothetical protein n=1 Tax=Burkholderia pseudomallei TaxID=28450 RepID=UPI000ADC374C|nr:hypothetical protein [Burkholderia pseudomallei]